MGEIILDSEENTSGSQFWQMLKYKCSGLNVINEPQIFNPNMKALVVFCPLYAHGSLETSELLGEGASIESSRVGGKWQVIKHLLNTMASGLHDLGGNMELIAILANKGVLLKHQPTQKDEKALDYHNLAYQKAVEDLTKQIGITCQYTNYDELGVNYPRFINPQASIPGIADDILDTDIIDVHQLVQALNIILFNSIKQPIADNKDTRRALSYLVNSFGLKSAFWLASSYPPFDQMIPQIIGQNGVYLSAERFGGLFKITNLTPGVKKMTRLELLIS